VTILVFEKLKYKKLVDDPITQHVWSRAFGKEFGNLAQGDAATNTPGTNSIFVMTHDEIRCILPALVDGVLESLLSCMVILSSV
jgi:hypothetical protein